MTITRADVETRYRTLRHRLDRIAHRLRALEAAAAAIPMADVTGSARDLLDEVEAIERQVRDLDR